MESLDVAGKLCVIAPMTYPNGDHFGLYFSQERNKQIFVSDEAATADNLLQSGIRAEVRFS
jgi:hypothetical protein